MKMKNYGKFIAKLRKQKGLTQLELANLLNVSDKTISKWETGRSIPDILLLPKLSKVLNVSVNELLNGGIIKKADYEDIIESNTISILDHSNEEIKRKNKIILGLIISFIVSFFIVGIVYLSSVNDQIKSYEQDTNYVSEMKISQYAYVLKELYEKEYTEDDFKKIALLEVKEMSEKFVGFLNGNQTISSYLMNLEKQYENHYELKKEKGIFKLYNIAEGDYYNLAKKLLTDKNEELITNKTNDYVDIVYDNIELFLKCFFLISFFTCIIYYIFCIKFISKRSWLKSIVKYFAFLLGIFLLSCLFSLLLDTAYNNLQKIYSSFNAGRMFVGNFFERGVIDICEILVIATIGIILNLLFNIKNIKKCLIKK